MLEGFYGMVLPVFAEEVDETLENITPIAEVSNETNENERAALKTIMVQLIIHEKGPYVDSDCVYKDVSVEVAQDATYDEVEDAIIKQCFKRDLLQLSLVNVMHRVLYCIL